MQIISAITGGPAEAVDERINSADTVLSVLRTVERVTLGKISWKNVQQLSSCAENVVTTPLTRLGKISTTLFQLFSSRQYLVHLRWERENCTGMLLDSV